MQQARATGEVVQHQAQQTVEDYPISTVLACFGIGIGVGVLLGSSLFSAPQPSTFSASNWFPSDRGNWFPSSNDQWFNANAASKWGKDLVSNAKSMVGY